MGSQIDQFNIVRLNLQPTTNYERFVGSRTAFRVVNGRVTLHLPQSDALWDEIRFVCSPAASKYHSALTRRTLPVNNIGDRRHRPR